MLRSRTAPPTDVFTAVTQYTSGAVSNYNGLTATFTQRLTYGFSIQANYTWSHAMDEISNGGLGEPFVATTNESILYQINPACLRCNNYGNADYDVRSYFSASYVWQTPWKFGNKFANGAFGGWTLSQNFFARTGLPFISTGRQQRRRQLHAQHPACFDHHWRTGHLRVCCELRLGNTLSEQRQLL